MMKLVVIRNLFFFSWCCSWWSANHRGTATPKSPLFPSHPKGGHRLVDGIWSSSTDLCVHILHCFMQGSRFWGMTVGRGTGRAFPGLNEATIQLRHIPYFWSNCIILHGSHLLEELVSLSVFCCSCLLHLLIYFFLSRLIFVRGRMMGGGHS